MSLFPTTSSALLSPCRKYRYKLTRRWQKGLPRACFIMLNPSVADATVNDPTIKRCLGFARQWGCGSLVVVNLFAYRATDPDQLLSVKSPIQEPYPPRLKKRRWTPCNALRILEAVRSSQIVVAAWGTKGTLRDQDKKVCELLKGYEVQCFGTTRDGHPKHPLYLKGDEPLQPFTPRHHSQPLTGRPEVTLPTGGAFERWMQGLPPLPQETDDDPEAVDERWVERDCEGGGGEGGEPGHPRQVREAVRTPAAGGPAEGVPGPNRRSAQGDGPGRPERVGGVVRGGPRRPDDGLHRQADGQNRRAVGVEDRQSVEVAQRYRLYVCKNGVRAEVGYCGSGYEEKVDSFLNDQRVRAGWAQDRYTNKIVYYRSRK